MEVFGALLLKSVCAEELIENLDGIVGANKVPGEPKQSTFSNQQSAIPALPFRSAVVK
jgi:hypothetical protein